MRGRLATPGHVASIRKTDFAPIFAQQSVREMERTQRTPTDVMQAAQRAGLPHITFATQSSAQ